MTFSPRVPKCSTYPSAAQGDHVGQPVDESSGFDAQRKHHGNVTMIWHVDRGLAGHQLAEFRLGGFANHIAEEHAENHRELSFENELANQEWFASFDDTNSN